MSSTVPKGDAMNLKTITAALTAAILAVGMTACNRNAGTGSSASDQYGKRSGSAASGSSSPTPSSPGSSSMGSPSRQASPDKSDTSGSSKDVSSSPGAL